MPSNPAIAAPDQEAVLAGSVGVSCCCHCDIHEAEEESPGYADAFWFCRVL
jgi:hypothetical protein